jgi:NAD(P)-dependent dehydrogenase (short-subunit alcohol dehydrogenase family)
LARRMKRKIPGHSIFISRYVARMPHRQISSRLAVKAALENFARGGALEYVTRGVRVNVISPGNGAAGSSPKVFEDRNDREFVPRVSPGKRNLPESIADAFVFLCSPLANQIKGQVLSSDFGVGIGSGL